MRLYSCKDINEAFLLNMVVIKKWFSRLLYIDRIQKKTSERVIKLWLDRFIPVFPIMRLWRELSHFYMYFKYVFLKYICMGLLYRFFMRWNLSHYIRSGFYRKYVWSLFAKCFVNYCSTKFAHTFCICSFFIVKTCIFRFP